jgi:hypothetical protein
MKPETPDIMTGVSGLQAGVSGLLNLKRQLNIKLNLKIIEKLNQSNINPTLHIQEFIT